MTELLEGTTIRREATVQELVAGLNALHERGRREELHQRIGCMLTVLGVMAGAILVALGLYWAMGVLGVLVLGIYYYASSLDPELADEPRIRFASALLPALEADGPVHLWMELNAYDMAIADENEPVDGGVRARWVQPWMTARYRHGGVERVLEVVLEAEQQQDGIKVVSEKVRHVLALEAGGTKRRLELDEFPDPAAVAAWITGR